MVSPELAQLHNSSPMAKPSISFFVMNIQCFWVEDFVDFLFVLFEEVMGFIILKILVIHFFVCSVVMGFIKSKFVV
jgi:hypothetical protein